MLDKKCFGCGATLTLEKTKPGFVHDLNMDFCQACYKLKHYKQVDSHYHPQRIPTIKDNSLVLVISSVMYLDLVFTYPIFRYAPNSKIVYIINQLDLLPYQTNYDYLLRRIKKEANIYHAKYDDIILMSSLDQSDIENLRNYLLTYQGTDIYLLGVQNSGKTTIFNALTNQSKSLTDVKAGLTQELITTQFDKYLIHDLPGLYQSGYIHEIISYSDYRKMIPHKQFKPIIYQVRNNISFTINELIGLNYLKGADQSIVFYFNLATIHRTNSDKIESRLSKNISFRKQTFKLPNQQKYQFTVADIGFIHLNGPAVVEIYMPQNIHLSLREAFFL